MFWMTEHKKKLQILNQNWQKWLCQLSYARFFLVLWSENMSVKLSGHRGSTTRRKEEVDLFFIMMGPSAPAPITNFKIISQKLQGEIEKYQLSRCPVVPAVPIT